MTVGGEGVREARSSTAIDRIESPRVFVKWTSCRVVSVFQTDDVGNLRSAVSILSFQSYYGELTYIILSKSTTNTLSVLISR